jgi:hypothetical protein
VRCSIDLRAPPARSTAPSLSGWGGSFWGGPTMRWIRRRTHCRVPGHGTHCLAVWENGNDGQHYRTTEERMAMEYEMTAEGRVAWLREAAAERARTMPDYPDPPEVVEERNEERAFWLDLQTRTQSWGDSAQDFL